MKNIAILILLAGTTVVCIQAAFQQVGTCSYESYNNKIRTCTTQFIKGLQQNPKGNCDVYRSSFINCSAVAVHTCLPLISVEVMKNALKAELTDELMCKRAGLQYPDPSSLNMTLPCTITASEYVTRINDCADELVKKWSANRGDPTLCSEYWDVKKCMKNIVDKHCQFKGDLLELMNYQFDDYNPFCANNVDPTSSPTTNPTTRPTTVPPSKGSSTAAASKAPNKVDPTSKVSSITVSKAVIAISLVVAAMQAF